MRKERECNLCPGRRCTDLNIGRLINDNEPATYPVDTRKIKTSQVKIKDCELREALETDDERNLLGS